MSEINIMATTLRFTKEEQRKIREKSIEINKILINSERAPLQESELVHKILEISISCVKVDKEGRIYLDI